MDVRKFIEEDIGIGDITTDTLVGNQDAIGTIFTKEPCVIAGLEEARAVFEHLGLAVKLLVNDGDTVKSHTKVITVKGKANAILKGERTALNLMMRMSGIATKTRAFVDLCRPSNPCIIIACTRKTTPGFRYFEKKAVVLGGGDPHRYGLDDAILIKDNHLTVVGSVTRAVALAKTQAKKLANRRTSAPDFAKRSFAFRKIEIEVQDLRGAQDAARAGADIVMLDNFKPKAAARAYKTVKAINPKTIVEVSGGITENNIVCYATNADVISIGGLTHSYQSIDISLDIDFVLQKKGRKR